jgi:hypothetical protein
MDKLTALMFDGKIGISANFQEWENDDSKREGNVINNETSVNQIILISCLCII